MSEIVHPPIVSRRVDWRAQEKRQLIVYHFMFDPDWDKGCPGCTGLVNAMGDLSRLAQRGTAFALVSRGSLAKLEKYRKEHGWRQQWLSSSGNDFNYDFHVTLDPAVMPPQYNYRDQAELEKRRNGEPWFVRGEVHGLSRGGHLRIGLATNSSEAPRNQSSLAPKAPSSRWACANHSDG
jgi:predicted dithiol-disulfide oxidoreductase (DUF899 family)